DRILTDRCPVGTATAVVFPMSTWTQYMREGDFERAWLETDRIELPRRRGIFCADQLLWDGSPLRNRQVLIRCRHGLGDAIQFIRYAQLLKDIGCTVMVKARPILVTLLRWVRGV